MRMNRDTGQTDGQTDRQTDRYVTKLIVTFRNFANAPKNETWVFMGPKKLIVFF